MKPRNWFESLNCAVEGVLQAVRSQRHMRWHAFASLAVLVFAPALGITPVEFVLLCMAAGMVLVAELLNTSVEAAVDLACSEYSPVARMAKDVAAGAVLVAAFVAVAAGWVVLYPKVRLGSVPSDAELPGVVPVASALLAVLVVVLLLKAIAGRGRPLHGGFPSGHACVSFAIATILALRTRDPAVAALSAVMAAMVSHSRLLHGIHTWREVAAGAFLGIGITLVLFLVFY